MIIETTNYFAKPGETDAVLAQRRKATAIRIQMGLEAGIIAVRVTEKGPDVRWQCSFANWEAYEADMKVRGSSEAFAQARKDMHTLLERFERHLHKTVPDSI